MSNGEIARRLEDIVRGMSALGERVLVREVYEANQRVLDLRLTSLENSRAQAQASQDATRKLIFGGIIAFGTNIAVSIVMMVIVALQVKGG